MSVGGADFRRGQVPNRKSDPETYERALAALGALAADCVAFEDSANGLFAAKAARLYTVVMPARWTMPQEFAGADLLLPSLGDPGAMEDAVLDHLIGAPYFTLAKIKPLQTAWQAGAERAQGAA